MPTIADLRAANPWAEDISDLELLDYRAQQTGTSLEDAAKAFGVKYNSKRNAFTAGLSAGTDELQGLGYGVLGAGARAVGLDSAANWADKNVRINNSEAHYNGRPDLENIEDQSLGSMPGYLVYQGAKQLPILAGTVAGAAVMPEAVVPAALSRGLAFAPRAVGGGGLSSSALNAAEGYAAKKALTNEALAAGNQFGRIGAAAYPMSVGSLYNEAVERGDPSQGDALAAFGVGVPYAAGEAVMPAIVTRGLGTGLGFKGNLPTRVGKAMATDALGEAGTELAQNEMEMGFAGPLTDEQMFSRRLNSAVAGGLVGGMYGAPAGIRQYRPPIVPGKENDLLGGNEYPALSAPIYTGTPNEALLNLEVDRANEVAAAERANRDLWAQRSNWENRDIPAGTQLGLPLDGGRMGQIDPMQQAAAGPLPAEYDPTNPAPNRRQMDLVFPETPEVIYGNQYNPASQPGSTGKQAGAFTQLPVTDEIRTPPGAVQQAVTAINGTRTIAQLKATADQALANNLISPDQHVEFYNTLDTNKKLKLVDKRGLLTNLIEGNQNGNQENVAGRQEGNGQAGQPQGVVSPREVGIPQGTQEGRGVQQGRQGQEGLLNGAETQEAVTEQTGQPTQVPVSATSPVVTYKRPGKLANVPQSEQVASQTLQASATQVAPDGKLRVNGTEVALGAEQQRVTNYVQKAIDNNELDKIVDAQGKLRAQDIATELGIKNRGSVAMALKGARERIAAAYGVSVDDVKAGLKNLDRQRRSVDESTQQKLGLSPDQQTQGVDEAELFGDETPFGIVGSLGQSQGKVETDENVESPTLEKVDPVRQRRDLEAHIRRQRMIDETLDSPYSGEAAQDWDDMKADGIPSSDQLDRETAYEWVFAYTQWKQGEISENDLAEEQRDLERQVLGKRSGDVRLEQNPDRLTGDGTGTSRPFASAARISGTPVQSTGSTQEQASGTNRASSDTGINQRPAVGRMMENPSRQAQDDIQFFKGKLDKDGRAGATVQAYEVPDALAPFVRAVEKLTKVRIQFVDVNDPSGKAGFGGMYAGRNVLFVNVRAGKPVSFIVGHEFLHYLKNADPDLFDRFTQLALPLLKIKEANAAAVKAGEYYTNLDKADQKEYGTEEVWADTFGDAWADPQFWEALADQNLTLAQRALRFLKKVVNQIAATLRGEQHTPVTEGLYKDFDAIKNLVLSATNEFVRRDGNPYLGDAETKASRDPSTPDGFFRTLGDKIQDLVDDPKALFSRVKLGWMTLEQIAERIEKVTNTTKAAAVKQYVNVMTAMQQYSKDLVYQAAKIDQDWAKLNPAVQNNMSQIMRDATRSSFDPDVDVAETAEQTALQKRYNALPETAKAVYKRVRDHYQKLFEERKAIMQKAAQSGTLPEKNRTELESMLKKFKGPYFPLMRLGKWYAVGMSKKLADLQAKVDDGTITPEETKTYNALRKDKAHYITSSFDSRSQARRAEKEMAKNYDVSYFNTAKEQLDNATKSVPDLSLMQDYLTSGLPTDARNDIKGMLAQMYFDLLPENSALKRMMKREGVYGEEEDMRKVFAASTISMAHHVSRLKYSTDLSAAMQGVRNLTKRGDEQMTTVYNELIARANIAMKSDDTPIADRMTQLSYLANLGLSPAFILTNMSQVPMITAPWLGARYGFGDTRSALAGSFADAARIIKGTIEKDGWQAEYDWSGLFKDGSGEDLMLKDLLDRNLLDITMEHDFGVVSRAAKTKAGKNYDTFIKVSALPVRVTEVANRLITGLSAYRLEMAKLQKAGGLSQDEMQSRAVEMAAKAVSETQLNYSALNAPRYMQSVFGSKALAKLMFQFRKYQQGMVYLIGKSAADAFKGDKEAAKTLLGLMTTTGLMAGATGLPFAGSVFWIATALGGLFDDDDEPFDAEVWFANYLADTLGDDAALAVRKGLPTLLGADLSNNVGMGNIGMPLPYIRNGNKPSDNMTNMLAASAGASFQTMQTMGDGIVEMANGDFDKGLEKVIPLKGAKNMLKAIRYGNEGMTDSKGNVILPPEQFSPWDLAMRGAGFSTTKETEYYDANSAMQNAKQAASDARQALLREYSEARLAGDDVAEFKDKIAEFNTRHPEKGVRIDQSSLLKAYQQRKRLAQERTSTGLRKDKTMKPYLDEARFADGE